MFVCFTVKRNNLQRNDLLKNVQLFIDLDTRVDPTFEYEVKSWKFQSDFFAIWNLFCNHKQTS